MYRIAKRFAFSASHQLAGLPDGHPCARLHGHNYQLEVELAADTLDDVGFVVDYGELRWLYDDHIAPLDHRHLNNLLIFNPTAENLARFFFTICRERWPQTRAVRVSETPNTWAEYRR